MVALEFLLLSSTAAQRGALTAPLGLDELTQSAETIVHGHVVSAKVEPHPQFRNLTTIVVSLSVEDTLKGKPSRTLQFRQYVWDIRDKLDAAGYRKGEELLLMLNPVSQYGLTSPVGLEQGRFRIMRDRNGNATAVNGRGNVALFESTEQRAREKGVQLSARSLATVRTAKPGPVPLQNFKEVIRDFVRSRR